MTSLTDIRRVDFGYFVRPGEETLTGRPRVEPCLGYLVSVDDGLLLLDTGMGAHADVDAHYQPVRRELQVALGDHGLVTGDVASVVNCHLHFDHCGGNPLLAGRPTFVQATELSVARSTEHYTLPELVDFDGVRYETLDGETEIARDVWVIPTPGHTDGHQSLVVRCTDGTLVLAGQAHDEASAFAADQLAWRAQREAHVRVPTTPAWMTRLLEFDPRPDWRSFPVFPRSAGG
ncbi:MAG: MBL fold metallo-hydrolase [Actinobacteria bacterium]|nr:MBL fold metallo-hydrolase [Actinomycetota bacterium]